MLENSHLEWDGKCFFVWLGERVSCNSVFCAARLIIFVLE